MWAKLGSFYSSGTLWLLVCLCWLISGWFIFGYMCFLKKLGLVLHIFCAIFMSRKVLVILNVPLNRVEHLIFT